MADGPVRPVSFGGGRGFPFNWLLWSSAGYANLVMDTRGQGSASLPGDTPDPYESPAGPHFPGFLTQGVLDPRTYYYCRLFTDAVRAIDAALELPEVDRERVIVAGSSQGGALSLAAAALHPSVRAAIIDVPFLSHIRRALAITDAAPYSELTRYLGVHRDQVETVFETLAYFDGMNLAPRATAPASFSAGLLDEVTPPSTVFAAYHHYAGPKRIVAWPYNGHDASQLDQVKVQLAFLREIGLAPASSEPA